MEQSLSAQDNVFLPLEPTNTAGMEPVATLLTIEDKKGAFLVRITSGITLMPKERVSQVIFALRYQHKTHLAVMKSK